MRVASEMVEVMLREVGWNGLVVCHAAGDNVNLSSSGP
jgi:hypothetical protein